MEGSGHIHIAQIDESVKPFQVLWEPEVAVAPGDCFIVPNGHAHYMEQTGSSDLVWIAGCSPSHVGEDRYVIPLPGG